MPIDLILIAAAVGVLAGVVSGLFGVGGGTVLVPLFLVLFVGTDIPIEYIMHFAVGSAFVAVLGNSLMSGRQHFKRGAVSFDVIYWAAPSLFAGVVIGAWIAAIVSSQTLVYLFSGFMLFTAFRMWRKVPPSNEEPNLGVSFPRVAVATIMGGVSAFFGIGGGALMVPWFNSIGLSAHSSVGTSGALGAAVALGGVLGFWVFGSMPSVSVDYATGFIYWPIAIPVLISSSIAVKYGVSLAHKMSPLILKRLFSAYLVLVAGTLVGVF